MKHFLKPVLIFVLFFVFFQSCRQPSPEETETQETDEGIFAEHVRTSEFQTPEEERLDFVLPEGFEVTLFASEPDITKPINMAFDEKGRLWVTQSSEYPVAAGQGEGRDRITILEDTDGDGKADKIQDFANDLNIPIGIVPIKNGAIAYSIPNVYKFLDEDGDGRSESREVLLGPFEHKDTHGMVNNLFRGFDGWIHASHGFSNISTVAGKDGHAIKMVSGNTFRFKSDGSRVEKTTDGRINPFGSDYDEMGYHYSADCHTLPIYQLIWGGSYTQWGKKEPNMGFAPTMMDYGLKSTALSGLVYYTDDQFPEEYRNSFYSGDVVTCRISQNTMEFNGSTPKAIAQSDFLVSKDPWFRPVDIKIGPDGAMYIADFYNRIIGHYEVPLDHPGRDRVSGRIWKITYKGNSRKVTDWSKASQEELIQAMGNRILQIRMVATDELVDRFGMNAIPALAKMVENKKTSPEQLIQGLWALYRLDALPDNVLQNSLEYPDRKVRLHAYKILSNYSQHTEKQFAKAISYLTDSDPHVQRAAAEFLSLHPNEMAYKKLIELHSNIPEHDTHLAYTMLMAISNHFQEKEILQMAVKENWDEKQAKVVALVISDLNVSEAGDFLLEHLNKFQESDKNSIGFTETIAKTISPSKIENLIQWVKQKSEAEPDVAHLLAKATEQGMNQRAMSVPTSYKLWYVNLAESTLKSIPSKLKYTDLEKEKILFATETAGKNKVSTLNSELKELLTKANSDEEIRSSAARALMTIDPKSNSILIAQTMSDSREEISMRRKLASALGLWENPKSRELLGEGLRNAPTELQETISMELAKSGEGKTQLMTYIKKGYAPARMLKQRAVEENMLANISTLQRKEFEALTANLVPISEERQKLIEERLAEFTPDNKSLADGAVIFEQNCSSCHQIDKKGGLIGPQLDGVGNWGQTALATKILDPNRNITENFRTYNISLNNGQTVSGLYRREEGQTIVLADQTGKEFSVSKPEIKEMIPSKYTLMPDNFNTAISKEEFNALLVYLLNTK
ncbi:PVC-type heme-binding CxxCH protein [Aquiflexum gelatinilyticum]|uniref:PVC-type heme-binding CxxCH protein n=1 Tax=Aquiflexum gelatinilyticum TaxID=2961943 RepID=UPI0021686062|nr:PVC-type heme-binding CxxCH protein [Aquiflexum gelatinilyticum]MCS4432877.1 c-type cytochrome [Aquiflexum gelatinilyticum]